MIETRCDKKGRVYLRQSIRSKYGERFIVVQGPDRMIFFPVPDDPIEDLAKLGKPLRRLSLKSIKKRIRDRAVQEVGT